MDHPFLYLCGTRKPAYPDLRNRFIEFLASLDAQPLEVELRDGSLAYLSKEKVNAIVHRMLYSYERYPVIPVLLESFISRNKLSLGVLLEGMQFTVENAFNVLGLIEYNYDHKRTVADNRRLVAEAKQNLKPYALVGSYLEFYLNDMLIRTDH